MSGKKWIVGDDAGLRNLWGEFPASEIAKSLKRSIGSVYQRANLIGLSKERDKKLAAKRKKLVRKYHALGWSDSEVAAKVGIDRRYVASLRKQLGIKANDRNDRYRKRVAKKTKQQLELAGVKNLAELKRKRVQEVAVKLGWPAHLSIRAIQIAQVLHTIGPMTRRQIAQAIGVKWRGSKTFGNSRTPGGSYLAELQRAGVVIRLDRAVRGVGKGTTCGLYMIALGAEPCPKAK